MQAVQSPPPFPGCFPREADAVDNSIADMNGEEKREDSFISSKGEDWRADNVSEGWSPSCAPLPVEACEPASDEGGDDLATATATTTVTATTATTATTAAAAAAAATATATAAAAATASAATASAATASAATASAATASAATASAATAAAAVVAAAAEPPPAAALPDDPSEQPPQQPQPKLGRRKPSKSRKARNPPAAAAARPARAAAARGSERKARRPHVAGVPRVDSIEVADTRSPKAAGGARAAESSANFANVQCSMFEPVALIMTEPSETFDADGKPSVPALRLANQPEDALLHEPHAPEKSAAEKSDRSQRPIARAYSSGEDGCTASSCSSNPVSREESPRPLARGQSSTTSLDTIKVSTARSSRSPRNRPDAGPRGKAARKPLARHLSTLSDSPSPLPSPNSRHGSLTLKRGFSSPLAEDRQAAAAAVRLRRSTTQLEPLHRPPADEAAEAAPGRKVRRRRSSSEEPRKTGLLAVESSRRRVSIASSGDRVPRLGSKDGLMYKRMSVSSRVEDSDDKVIDGIRLQARDLISTGLVHDRIDPNNEPRRLSADYRYQANTDFYTLAALRKRRSLRRDKAFLASTESLWAALPNKHARGLDKAMYIDLFLFLANGWNVLQKHPKLQNRSLARILEDEWPSDAQGLPYLTEAAFTNAIFDLVDTWTESVDASAYVNTVKNIEKRVKASPDVIVKDAGEWSWRLKSRASKGPAAEQPLAPLFVNDESIRLEDSVVVGGDFSPPSPAANKAAGESPGTTPRRPSGNRWCLCSSKMAAHLESVFTADVRSVVPLVDVYVDFFASEVSNATVDLSRMELTDADDTVTLELHRHVNHHFQQPTLHDTLHTGVSPPFRPTGMGGRQRSSSQSPSPRAASESPPATQINPTTPASTRLTRAARAATVFQRYPRALSPTQLFPQADPADSPGSAGDRACNSNANSDTGGGLQHGLKDPLSPSADAPGARLSRFGEAAGGDSGATECVVAPQALPQALPVPFDRMAPEVGITVVTAGRGSVCFAGPAVTRLLSLAEKPPASASSRSNSVPSCCDADGPADASFCRAPTEPQMLALQAVPDAPPVKIELPDCEAPLLGVVASFLDSAQADFIEREQTGRALKAAGEWLLREWDRWRLPRQPLVDAVLAAWRAGGYAGQDEPPQGSAPASEQVSPFSGRGGTPRSRDASVSPDRSVGAGSSKDVGTPTAVVRAKRKASLSLDNVEVRIFDDAGASKFGAKPRPLRIVSARAVLARPRTYLAGEVVRGLLQALAKKPASGRIALRIQCPPGAADCLSLALAYAQQGFAVLPAADAAAAKQKARTLVRSYHIPADSVLVAGPCRLLGAGFGGRAGAPQQPQPPFAGFAHTPAGVCLKCSRSAAEVFTADTLGGPDPAPAPPQLPAGLQAPAASAAHTPSPRRLEPLRAPRQRATLPAAGATCSLPGK
ncbi:hypothetical protein DIPPA_05243 [Diplonema papillatum]|nr:hypothetical protein DIPPA_05243 [Diplonema papillatum]